MTSVGQKQFDSLVFCLFENFQCQFNLALFDQRFADFVTLCLEEGEDHGAADQDRIDLFEKVFKDIYLPGYF